MVGGQHQFGRHHVFPHRPHIPPGRCRRQNLDRRSLGQVDPMGVFDLDHRIGVGRQRIAGVQRKRLDTQLELHRTGLRRTPRRLGKHSKPIHGRCRIVRRRDQRPDRFCGDAAQRLVERDALGRQRLQQGLRCQRCMPAGQRLTQRHIMQIQGVRVHDTAHPVLPVLPTKTPLLPDLLTVCRAFHRYTDRTVYHGCTLLNGKEFYDSL